MSRKMDSPQSTSASPRRRSSADSARPNRRFTPRARDRSDDANAFFPDPGDGPAHAPEDLSDDLAEQFVEAATTGQDADEQQLDSTVPEEIGGPFVETTAAEEIAFNEDPMNPPDAEREPLPRPVAGLVTDPTVDDHLDHA